MSRESYNGWLNRATWLVNVWLGDYLSELPDDEKTPEALESICAEICNEGESLENGLMSDLLSVAWGSIDWRELSESYMEN